MKYNFDIEKENLKKENYKLIAMLLIEKKNKLILSSIGNSISDGFSFVEPDKLLLDRNDSLVKIGKRHGINVITYQLSRSENNNGLIVADWIRNNLTEKDCYDWNIADYKRAIESGNPLLTEMQIKEYFNNPSNVGVKDMIFSKADDLANIVILNLGTGSFLDILTRHGKKSPKNIKDNIQRDRNGIIEILEMIQSSNRRDDTKTQVYLCGAPKVGSTAITDVFMNNEIKKLSNEYANVTYVPSFKRQTIYNKDNGSKGLDIHYNRAEYLHFLKLIQEKIVQNYVIRDAEISIDSKLFEMSDENDVHFGKYGINDALEVIDFYAKKVDKASSGCDYNTFINNISKYISRRYPYDFFRLYKKENIGNVAIKKLKI